MSESERLGVEIRNRLFESYSRMAVETQTHIQKLITMLVRSMGAKNAKILDLIKSAPAGAEELVLRVIAILTEKGKTAPPLVALIKEMATERELSPRYMVAVVADLDKVIYNHHEQCISAHSVLLSRNLSRCCRRFYPSRRRHLQTKH